jgi:dinuclear metal center YbgI/SA1388 family protein
VLAEAIRRKCDLVISYHPPLFQPIKTILADSGATESIIHRLIASGIAVYSPHTALDAAAGGTNDVLAELCKLTQVEPFEYVNPPATNFKVVTFVPETHLEMVASALFAAGAGRIGDYEQCSYRLKGEGTFFGSEQTNPRLGQRGRVEKVAETRLETVVGGRCLSEVIAALTRSHPYEEPAFDIYPLTAAPVLGIGRVGQLPKGTTLASLARTLRRATRSKNVSLVGPPGTRISRAAVCVGAAGRLPFEKNRSRDCQVIVTGEIRHHDALTILRQDKTAIALGHWESEQPILQSLSKRLIRILPSVAVSISQSDAPPLHPLGAAGG